MILKPIELLTLQKGAPERITLAEIDLEDHESELTYCFNPEAMHEKYWAEISEQYEVNNLLRNYVEGIRKLQQLVTKIVQGTENEDKASLEVITQHPYVYASPDAYNMIKPKIKKEKEADQETNPVAHLSWGEGREQGIFVSLRDHYDYQDILSSNIHEHGHYLHYILHPAKYNGCDDTLREVMAIFMEMKCGLSTNYIFSEPGKETSHHRAQQILQQLEKTEFYSSLDKKEQWEILVDFQTHSALQEFAEELLRGRQEQLQKVVIGDEPEQE